jgi:hypothetical protein
MDGGQREDLIDKRSVTHNRIPCEKHVRREAEGYGATVRGSLLILVFVFVNVEESRRGSLVSDGGLVSSVPRLLETCLISADPSPAN